MDFVIVAFSLLEILVEPAAPVEGEMVVEEGGGGGNYSALRLVRMLRLLRVARVGRLAHRHPAIAQVMMALSKSFNGLWPVGMLLLLFLFILRYRCTTLCHATPRHATPRHATPRQATRRHATPRHATPRAGTPCHNPIILLTTAPTTLLPPSYHLDQRVNDAAIRHGHGQPRTHLVPFIPRGLPPVLPCAYR